MGATVNTGPRVESATKREISPTFVVAVELLFARLGSDSVADTLAALPIIPAVVVVTVSVTVALAPLAKFPRLHVNTPPDGAAQLPWLVVVEPTFTAVGSVSVSVTPVAGSGPLFVTVIV